MATLLVFLALQFADFATTLWFLHLGKGEANPLVAALIGALGRPALAVLLVKAAGCGIAAFAWKTRRLRLLRRATLFFALCVAWNLMVIARG